MFGGSTPPEAIEEAGPYDRAWLGLRLPDGTEVTLSRSLAGQAFTVFPGLVTAAGDDGFALGHEHDRNPTPTSRCTCSGYSGSAGRNWSRTRTARRTRSVFRDLAPYLFTPEEIIIAKRSPILASGQHIFATFERNVFKLLLTGIDDSAVTPSVPPKMLAAAKAGKIELVDEWLARIDRELGEAPPSRDELAEQAVRLEESLEGVRNDLAHAQDRLDSLVTERRRTRDAGTRRGPGPRTSN